MEVKEVIEFLKEWNKFKPYRNSAMNITQLNKTMDSVIDLLQQGEAYEENEKKLIQERDHWRSMYLDKRG